MLRWKDEECLTFSSGAHLHIHPEQDDTYSMENMSNIKVKSNNVYFSVLFLPWVK